VTNLEIAIIIAIAVVSALVKAITGAGFPMLVVPVLALFIDVADAIVVVAIPNVTMNGAIFWSLRHERRESPALPRFLVATSVGAVIGSLLLSVLSETVLRLGLVAIIVLFVANRLSDRRFTLTGEQALRLAPAAGAVSGMVFGATAVSGPLVTPWFLSQNLRRDVYVVRSPPRSPWLVWRRCSSSWYRDRSRRTSFSAGWAWSPCPRRCCLLESDCVNASTWRRSSA